MCFKHFHRPLVFLFALWSICRPDVRFAILASADDVPRAVHKSRSNLTAIVFMALELHFQAFIFHVVDSQTGVVTGD
jgi:hypothetical protein